MNAELERQLLALQPFKRFVLVTITGHEYEVKSPKHYQVLTESETLFWAEDGTADFVDLNLVERIRMDDDFGFHELSQLPS